jgi:hypothetical protein
MDKELLLKDLCARLPYGVIVQDRNGIHPLTPGNTEFVDLFSGKCNIKPFLRPMSSMTDEEKKQYDVFCLSPYLGIDEETASNFIDWLNAHHFDYRELIEKGLAIEAPEGIYS